MRPGRPQQVESQMLSQQLPAGAGGLTAPPPPLQDSTSMNSATWQQQPLKSALKRGGSGGANPNFYDQHQNHPGSGADPNFYNRSNGAAAGSALTPRGTSSGSLTFQQQQQRMREPSPMAAANASMVSAASLGTPQNVADSVIEMHLGRVKDYYERQITQLSDEVIRLRQQNQQLSGGAGGGLVNSSMGTRDFGTSPLSYRGGSPMMQAAGQQGWYSPRGAAAQQQQQQLQMQYQQQMYGARGGSPMNGSSMLPGPAGPGFANQSHGGYGFAAMPQHLQQDASTSPMHWRSPSAQFRQAPPGLAYNQSPPRTGYDAYGNPMGLPGSASPRTLGVNANGIPGMGGYAGVGGGTGAGFAGGGSFFAQCIAEASAGSVGRPTGMMPGAAGTPGLAGTPVQTQQQQQQQLAMMQQQQQQQQLAAQQQQAAAMHHQGSALAF